MSYDNSTCILLYLDLACIFMQRTGERRYTVHSDVQLKHSRNTHHAKGPAGWKHNKDTKWKKSSDSSRGCRYVLSSCSGDWSQSRLPLYKWKWRPKTPQPHFHFLEDPRVFTRSRKTIERSPSRFASLWRTKVRLSTSTSSKRHTCTQVSTFNHLAG